MKTVFYTPIKLSSFLVGIFLLTLIACQNTKQEDKKTTFIKKDNIEIWLEQSESRKLTPDERRKALGNAYKATSTKKPDSVKLFYLKEIAYIAEFLNNDPIFRKANPDFLKLAIKLNDTSNIGEAYWNYALFYREKEALDSSYYNFQKAYKSFKAVKNEKYTARMLYNLGYIQSRIKDYTGCEVSIFEAIPIFDKLNSNEDQYRCYNLLGLVYQNLYEYERAIFYHNKALTYLYKIEDKRYYKEASFNNLGLVYQKQKNYNKAIENFEVALSNNTLKQRELTFYAKLIDNLTYTKFLKGDTLNVERDFNYSLQIRDSLKNLSGLELSKSHLSEYYASKLDTPKAVIFGREALNLANQINNNRDKLKNLLLLAKIDKTNTSTYLEEYVHLNDSLQIEERKTRNKFTRLRFETDEYIQETEKLSQQKVWISLGAFIAIFFLVSAYIMRIQRARNKELVFEREQQKSNEEIYSLMLKQQSHLEEGRLRERHRISEDLHDGVLGKIFGARLGLGFLNIKADEETTEKLNFFTDELQTIEKEIRTISHELKNEILSSKEDFFKIIEELIQQKSKLGSFEYTFNYSDQIDWDEIDDAIKINFYRIIQEVLQNIIKYAKATNVDLSIQLEENQLFLTIKDNGKGFDTSEKRKGIGLKNMKSRTEKINGEFNIHSKIKKGTTIVVSCPI